MDVDLRRFSGVNPKEEDTFFAGSLRQFRHFIRDLVLLILRCLELLKTILKIIASLADGMREVREPTSPCDFDVELLRVIDLEVILLAGFGLQRVETIEHELFDEPIVRGVLYAELAIEKGLS